MQISTTSSSLRETLVTVQREREGELEWVVDTVLQGVRLCPSAPMTRPAGGAHPDTLKRDIQGHCESALGLPFT